MRIIAGRFGGRIIAAPSGTQTRPTTDRVREAMMSALLSACPFALEDAEVLDLFAGSGALGLELISRGARHATFVEKNRSTARILQSNIDQLGLERTEAKLVVQDVFTWAKRLTAISPATLHPYHLVTLDPPYALEVRLVMQLVETLLTAQALAPGAVILYEHAAERTGLIDLLSDKPHSQLHPLKTKRMGTVAYDMIELCMQDC